MKIFSKKILPAIFLLLPALMDAHEGHGVFHGDDIRHYWYSATHAIPVIVLVLVFVALLIHTVQLNKKVEKKNL